jgi:hypothetical protein
VSSEIFWLYLLTRLDGISCLLGITLVLGLCAYGAFILVWTCEGTPAKYKGIVPLWKVLAIVAVLGVLVPTKKDVAFILAGTGVLEAAKTYTAQRIAGKSVTVVEKYLDELLKEEKKDGN